MDTHIYKPKGIKLHRLIKDKKIINIRISLNTSKEEAIKFLSRKLCHYFKDLIIIDTETKSHHRHPKIVPDIFKIYKNTLLIYRDIEAYKKYEQNNNYVILLTYGYEIQILNFEKIFTCKLMINNFKTNFIINVINITKPIKRDPDVEFEMLLNNNPDYKDMAYLFVEQLNNKLIIAPNKNYKLFKKIIDNLVLDIKLTDTYEEGINPIALYTQDVDIVPTNVQECHFMSNFDSKIIISVLSKDNYSLSYPRNLYIYIYNVHDEHLDKIQNFVLKIDMLKTITEELLENEIHLLNDELSI